METKIEKLDVNQRRRQAAERIAEISVEFCCPLSDEKRAQLQKEYRQVLGTLKQCTFPV